MVLVALTRFPLTDVPRLSAIAPHGSSFARPVGGHGFGLHEAPEVHTPVHEACSVLVHVNAHGSQHEPAGGHVFGSHTVPGPWNTLVPVQPEAIRTRQDPVVEQHAPSCASQSLTGVQVVPAPRNVLVEAVQPPAERTVHVPVLEQHAPTSGHGTGSHTVLSPWYDSLAVHAPDGRTVQMPDVVLQHAPVTHGFGPQVVPAPWYTFVPVQLVGTRIVHTPPVEQHAPFSRPHGFGVQVVPSPW